MSKLRIGGSIGKFRMKGWFKMTQNKKLLFLSSALLATSVFVAPIAEASTYSVHKGDALTKIAKANKTAVQRIKKVNVGDKQVVKNSGHTATNKPNNDAKTEENNSNTIDNGKSNQNQTNGTSSSPQNSSSQPGVTTYVVVKGDTLTKIAKQYNANVAQLKEWNNLKTDTIYVGQTLKIGNYVTTIELGEPVQQDGRDGLAESDQLIEEQLNNETTILSNNLEEGHAIYNKVIEIATSLLGKPYLFGGNTPEGFDCSGFVRYVYANAGLDIVRKSSKDYFFNDTTVVESPIPGDVVFFKDTYEKGISHMGIYIGNGEFIHAGTKAVERTKLEYEYWDSHFVAFKRFNQLNSYK